MTLVPQLGLPELLVMAVLVLLVVGPNDLPKFLHSAGKMAGKARRLADEFRAGLSQMAREAEMDEMRKEIDALKRSATVPEADQAMRDINEAVRKPVEPAKPAPADDEEPKDQADGHG
ncbi:MAG: twin-arginine translocase subunit TatB [Parvularculaceae bacterium]|nr:twin-arginine translocase subunit TatB [Parvularculaceae bacterium]